MRAAEGISPPAPTPLALGLNSFAHPPIPDADRDLTALTNGGPLGWPQKLETQTVLSADHGPFAADGLTALESDPWLVQARFTELDFFPDGSFVVTDQEGFWNPKNRINRVTVDPTENLFACGLC